jgi:hypothetical protein
MANANSPRGLVPYALMSGAPYNGSFNTYYVPVGNSTALYLGDPVTVLDNSADANGVPAVGVATASTGYITGAFIGVVNNGGQLTIPLLQSTPIYLPASTAAYVAVTDDPGLLYMIQEDGAMVAGAASRNAGLVAGSGSTVTGLSGWQLHSSSLATTNTLQMRIMRALQESDNAIGTNAKWLCRINLHTVTYTTGT